MWQQLARLMGWGRVPGSVTLREVGLRDGLHSTRTPLSTLLKFDWVLLGYAAGLRDTVGIAQPRAVHSLFSQVRKFAKDRLVSAHLHDTGDRSLANVAAALEAGVDRFDASLAGIGGSSFLPNISGNVSIEEVTSLLASKRIETGIELSRLRELHDFVQRQPDARGFFDALSHPSRGMFFQLKSGVPR